MIEFQGFPSLDLNNGVFRACTYRNENTKYDYRVTPRRLHLMRASCCQRPGWFDPFVSTLGFWVFINVYWYHERRLGVSSSSRWVETLDIGLGPLYKSGLAYWVGIYLWKLIIPPAALVIPDGIPSNLFELAYISVEVISGIVLYDASFFFVHWAMHEIPMLRCWHRVHHDLPEGTLESRDTLRHSLMDGTMQVLLNILVQRRTPWGVVKTRLARVLHNIIVIWMLTESHSAAPAPNIWRRWCVGVREHRLHHCGALLDGVYGKHHRHQQFFGYLDDLRAAWTERRFAIKVKRRKQLN